MTRAETANTETAVVRAGTANVSTSAVGRVRGADITVVTASTVGRIERRLFTVGDTVVAGEPIVEFGALLDDAATLRIEILELERELAELEGRTDDVAAVADSIAAIRSDASRGAGAVVAAPVDGRISGFIADLTSDVEPGDPVATIATGDELVVDVSLPASQASASLAVDDVLMIVDAGDPLAEPVEASIASVRTSENDGNEPSVDLTVAVPPDVGFDLGDRVELAADSQGDALLVAAAAVRTGQTGDFVILLDADRSWTRIDVEVGATVGGEIELIDPSGRLAPGSELVL